MKIRDSVRLVNLLLTGLLAGNELGTWSAVHPALKELDAPERLRAEQGLTRSYGAIMPFWMFGAVFSCTAALLVSRGTEGFRGTLLGTACFFAMLASTRLGNVPINDRTLELSEDDLEEFEELRDRWDRLHTLRVLLTVAGFGSLAAGALAGERR